MACFYSFVCCCCKRLCHPRDLSDDERDILTPEKLVRSGSGGDEERDLALGMAQRSTDPYIKEKVLNSPFVVRLGAGDGSCESEVVSAMQMGQ